MQSETETPYKRGVGIGELLPQLGQLVDYREGGERKVKGPCKWDPEEALRRDGIVPDYSHYMRDVTSDLFRKFYQDLDEEMNIYLALSGLRLGIGKSSTILTFAIVLTNWLENGDHWSWDRLIYGPYEDARTRYASLLRKVRDHFSFGWDEQQNSLSNEHWRKYRAEISEMIETQRQDQINIFGSITRMYRIYIDYRLLLTGHIHISERCDDHVHGWLFTLNENPYQEIYVRRGWVSIPNPYNPKWFRDAMYEVGVDVSVSRAEELSKLMYEYKTTYKRDLMASARQRYYAIREPTPKLARKFIQWCSDQPDVVGWPPKRGSGGSLLIGEFCDELGISMNTAKRNILWVKAKRLAE